jgi:hypothetical protein
VESAVTTRGLEAGVSLLVWAIVVAMGIVAFAYGYLVHPML